MKLETQDLRKPREQVCANVRLECVCSETVEQREGRYHVSFANKSGWVSGTYIIKNKELIGYTVSGLLIILIY